MKTETHIFLEWVFLIVYSVILGWGLTTFFLGMIHNIYFHVLALLLNMFGIWCFSRKLKTSIEDKAVIEFSRTLKDNLKKRK